MKHWQLIENQPLLRQIYKEPPIISYKRGRSVKDILVMYRSNRSFNMPPPGIPRAFDTFAVPGRREFGYQSLPGGGEFDPHAFRGGEFELHPRFHVKFLAWRAIMGTWCYRIFVEKIVPLWPIGYDERA